jgi:hypothetical protein
MDNTSPAAASVLLALTGSDAFLAHVLRMQLLVHALAPIRPAPAEAVRYWTSVAQPGSPLAYDVAQALCVNQSRPAMELLLAMLNNPATERPEKQSWMRELMLPRRDQPPVLWCAEQFLASAPTVELKGDMCEALFAYRPDDWYIECEPPLPPALAAASATAKEMLLRIGLQALTSVPLNPGQRATVEDVVEQLGGEIPGPRR